MKKSDLLAVFGSLQGIGDVFAPLNNGAPLTRSAVGQWDEDIPELREYQIRELMPDIDRRITVAKRKQRATA